MTPQSGNYNISIIEFRMSIIRLNHIAVDFPAILLDIFGDVNESGVYNIDIQSLAALSSFDLRH